MNNKFAEKKYLQLLILSFDDKIDEEFFGIFLHLIFCLNFLNESNNKTFNEIAFNIVY